MESVTNGINGQIENMTLNEALESLLPSSTKIKDKSNPEVVKVEPESTKSCNNESKSTETNVPTEYEIFTPEGLEVKIREKMKLCLDVLAIGISPPAHSIENTGNKGNMLHVVWDSLVNQCRSMLKLNAPASDMLLAVQTDASWRLSVTLLDVLVQLKVCVDALETLPQVKNSGINVLSIQSQVHIQKAVSIITGLGLANNLPPGVGIQSDVLDGSDLAPVCMDSMSDFNKFLRMGYILDELNTLCNHPTFAQRILGRSLIHYLAAILHLSYSPISNPRKKTNRLNPLSTQDYIVLMTTQKKLREAFEKEIMPIINKPNLVKCIFPLSSDVAPKWYRGKCRELTLEIFLSEDGMKAVARGLYDLFEGGSSLVEVTHVMRNLITESLHGMPMDRMRQIAIYMCHQSIDMIICGEKDYKKKDSFWSPVGAYCALVLTAIDACSSRKIIWNRVFNSLFSLNYETHNPIVSCDEVEYCMFLAEHILSYREIGTGMQNHIILFRPVWNIMFKIFVCMHKYMKMPVKLLPILEKIEPLCTKLENILALYLEVTHSNGEPRLIEVCLDFLIPRNYDDKGVPLRFLLKHSDNEDSSKSVTIVKDYFRDETHSLYEIIFEDSQHLFEAILSKKGRSKAVLTSLFAQLISNEYEKCEREKLTDLLSSPKNLGNPEKVMQHLDLKDNKDLQKFVTLTLLAEFGGEGRSLTDSINIDQGKDSLVFSILIFRRLVGEMEDSEEVGESFLFMGSLDYALHLTLAFTEVVMNPSPNTFTPTEDDVVYNWSDLDPFLPFLKKIMDSKHVGIDGASVQTFAEDVYIRIKTRGSNRDRKETEIASRYTRAIKNISNPAPFIKGHGLVDMKKCIEEKDPEAIANSDKLVRILFKELNSDDSYVYLLSVAALCALGSSHHQKILPNLLQEYAQGMKNGVDPDEVLQARLKVGQTITGILKNLGAVGQIYRTAVLNVCFTVLRDDDSLIRASALSTLAELAFILKYSLLLVVTEIWRVAEEVMRVEKESDVRRAALYLVSQSLRGLSPTITSEYILSAPEIGSNLRDIRRKLQLFRQTERDPACILHVQMCLEELSEIGTKLLTPDSTLEKHIRILR